MVSTPNPALVYLVSVLVELVTDIKNSETQAVGISPN